MINYLYKKVKRQKLLFYLFHLILQSQITLLMYISLNQPGQIKTQRSEFSNIDMFSKLESSFLEKFFKYNLNDYFQDSLSNIYENVFDKKLNRGGERQDPTSTSKIQKYVSSSLFIAQNKFTVEEFEKNTQNFYRDRSSSVSKNELPYAFKLRHNNFTNVPSLIKPGQLIFVDVKIKADIQKIQQLPEKIIKHFQHFRVAKGGKLSKLQELLSRYKQQHFNIFIVYFGDSNFQLFDKKTYRTNTIKLMGNFHKLRIFVFYVSKQALIETFKTINRIQNLEYINDLVIQFYELKREKERRKRIKRSQNKSVKSERNQQVDNETFKEKVYMLVGVFGLVGFGFAIKKLLT